MEYLSEFITNSATKRVKVYGPVGLAHNTNQAYKSLYRATQEYEFEKYQKLHLDTIDKNTAKSLNLYIKI